MTTHVLVVLGFDPKCLSIELPKVICERTFSQGKQTILYRHYKSRFLWKVQKWLQIGEEKKYTENQKILDQALYEKTKSKRKIQGQQQFDLINALLNEMGDGKIPIDDKYNDSVFSIFNWKS